MDMELSQCLGVTRSEGNVKVHLDEENPDNFI